MQDPLFNLLEKYNVPGPRYTSYPTAPAWTTQIQKENYASSLASLGQEETLSLYFHLPFCEKLCHFCGCMKVITTDHSRSRVYVDTILKELELVMEKLPKGAKRVSQLHFGGGTPNFLQPEELAEIMQTVRGHFDFLSNAEVAIEMHPRTSTPEFCEKLAELKFNRISLGIQDFDPKVQALINRHQTYEMTETMLSLLRRLGLKSFNFDLIYGLPGQSLKGFEKTLQQVIELRPNRLAVYSYAHVPWVSPVQRSFKDSDLPSPTTKLQLFEKAYQTLGDHGYRPIGMDHFALKEDELSQAFDQGSIHRNFMGYSTQAEAHQLGFGVSAISYVGGNYFQNLKELSQYEDAIRNKNLATFRGFLLSRDDALRRDLITRLMCNGLVNVVDFEKKWDLDFKNYFSSELENLRAFEKDQLIQISDHQLKAVNKGHLFLRNLSMVFDRYLEKIQKDSKTPTFSKTI